MKSTLHTLAVCAALLLGTLQTARAADTTPAYPDLLLDDVKHIVTAPARWEQQQWQDFGLATLAVVGTAAFIDRPLRDEMRRHNGNSRFMRDIERFGAQYSLGILGGFFLAGTVGDNDKALAVAQDGLTASIIASGIVTPALKYVTGRSRPSQSADVYRFRPFSGAASFPSGHTTQAFAVASVISSHYDETWIKCTSYSVAGLVGVARTYHDAHFASDVLAGALIGTLVGQSVVDYNQQRRAGKVALVPDMTPGQLGLSLAGNF
ncbi:MAG: phosphatase PAP2 family protein [Sideroxydans sp.]|nr:phosphatase PAP2 family protein [Sideroxydans sp.]